MRHTRKWATSWTAASAWALAGLALGTASAAAADEPPAVSLPLARVVLFNSGVGYFEHQGEVEGNAAVDLKFRVEDVNDLLKSMVLQDLGGGRISTVSYASKDPIDKTLKTFAIDLTTNPTLADLLQQVRGETVEVEAPDALAGVIVGVETRRVQVGKDEVVEADYLNLLTDRGLRTIALQNVGRIKLANERLDGELRQALAVLASAHAMDKKTVTLKFLGEGKRPVRVGYILQAPIWKTSYRLVLRDDGPATLQGWAIVENTTEEDWKEADLALVSGRPISFVMNLYDPLYVKRPTVEPELFASLRPQTYGQDLGARDREFAEKAPPAPAAAAAVAAMRKSAGRPEAQAEAASDEFAADGAPGGGRGGRFAMNLRSANFANSVGAAQSGSLGELFEYRIEEPVSLARQRSAMLPIVNQAVEAEKLSIYNANVHVKHPLNGLRFKNTTDLHLMQGPITVFDAGGYAGDARIEDLPPGSERLVSYAVDLDVEVAPEAKPHPEELASVKIARGVLFASRKYRRETKYTVKNSGREAAKILIEHPFDAQWTLVKPGKPSEKTRDMYRFAVDAAPGKPEELVVVEEMTQTQQVAVANVDDNLIRLFLSASVVDDKVKNALREVVARKQKIAEVAGRLQSARQQIESIGKEQDRIRQNMATLDRNSDLYRRYVGKFGEQEDEIEGLKKKAAAADEEIRRLQADLDAYLVSLDVG
jgi:hypothetical protein